MNLKIVSYFISVLLALIGAAIAFTGYLTLMLWTPANAWKMILIGTITLFVFLLTAFHFRPKNSAERVMGIREGFAVVGLGWLSVSLIGSLPYIVCCPRSFMTVSEAIFETASGFSTTGATILPCVEQLPKGLLFWRALTHWLGGMGIVVLTIAILPLLHINGQALFNAEVSGLKTSDSKIAPRIASEAKMLWFVYMILTVVLTAFLWAGPMDLFDAVCHAFSTIATGGFSTKTASIGFFHSSYVDYVTIFFMFISSCNYILLVKFLFQGKLSACWHDEEFRHFLFLILAAALITTLLLTILPLIADKDYLQYYQLDASQKDSFLGAVPAFFGQPLTSFRYALFQVVSIASTTGFSTADYQLWPFGAQMVLFVLMFIGGCSGSTSGGLKCVRIAIAAKHGLLQIRRAIFPHIVPAVRLNGIRLEQEAMYKIGAFIALFFTSFLMIAGILILLSPNSEEMDFTTALSASISCLSNVGPGFGNIGPSVNYHWMTGPAKLLLSFAMILGRLELYSILVLFLPSLWKK